MPPMKDEQAQGKELGRKRERGGGKRMLSFEMKNGIMPDWKLE